MAVGKICQFFYLEKVRPLLHFFPPPSRIFPQLGSDFSAGACPFLKFLYLEKLTERGHIPILQVQGGPAISRGSVDTNRGARETTPPVSEVSSHA